MIIVASVACVMRVACVMCVKCVLHVSYVLFVLYKSDKEDIMMMIIFQKLNTYVPKLYEPFSKKDIKTDGQ